MPLYKSGDRVVVRHDLNIHDVYWMNGDYDRSKVNWKYCNTVTDSMAALAGETVVIESVNSQYELVGHNFRWTDEMFEGLESKIADDSMAEVNTVSLFDLLGG